MKIEYRNTRIILTKQATKSNKNRTRPGTCRQPGSALKCNGTLVIEQVCALSVAATRQLPKLQLRVRLP